MFLTRYNLHIVHDCCRLSAQSNTTRRKDGKKGAPFWKTCTVRAQFLWVVVQNLLASTHESISRKLQLYPSPQQTRQIDEFHFFLPYFVFFLFKITDDIYSIEKQVARCQECNRRFSSSTRRFPPRDEGRTFAEAPLFSGKKSPRDAHNCSLW